MPNKHDTEKCDLPVIDGAEICVPLVVMDEIYISLKDSYERIENGKMGLKRVINFLETTLGYEPPNGYLGEKENG